MSEDERYDDDKADIVEGEEILFGLNFHSIRQGAIATEGNDEPLPLVEPEEDELRTRIRIRTQVDELCHYHEDTSSKPLATQADFVHLFQWASQQGAVLDSILCQTDSFGGRGLFTTKDIQTGEVIAVLPRSLRWGQSHACRVLRLPKSTPDLTALTLLVLQLSRQDHVYAKCLPRREQFTNALLMSPEEQNAWKQIDESYYGAMQRVQSIAEGCQGYIRHVLLDNGHEGETLDNHQSASGPTLLWAIAMVKSRSHAFGSKRGYWLTPVLDLLNHSPTPNAVLTGGDEGQLLLQALSPIPKEDEITIDYQVEDDAMMLANYGFSLVHKAPTVEAAPLPLRRLSHLILS